MMKKLAPFRSLLSWLSRNRVYQKFAGILLLIILSSGSPFDQVSDNSKTASHYHSTSVSVLNQVPCEGGDILEQMEGPMLDGVPVSISEQVSVGASVKQEMAKKGFSYDQGKINRIKNVFSRLMRYHRSDFSFEIYLIKQQEINAFTAGGKIFVTEGMMNFIQTDDELAGVIGHEIWHNELGHIKRLIQRSKMARSLFGNELGDMVRMTGEVMGAAFNQPKEIDADLNGLDLSIAAGYDGCQMIELWSRMNRMEGQHSMADAFFRSHPYSSDRVSCIRKRLSDVHRKSCY